MIDWAVRRFGSSLAGAVERSEKVKNSLARLLARDIFSLRSFDSLVRYGSGRSVDRFGGSGGRDACGCRCSLTILKNWAVLKK